jgi:hypothetical protein
MTLRAAIGSCVLTLTVLAAGKAAKPDEQPEFYFTRLQYSAGGPAADHSAPGTPIRLMPTTPLGESVE